MARTTTIRYIVETDYNVLSLIHVTPMEWRTRRRGVLNGYGRPTAANLAKFMTDLNDSYGPGGVNEHVGHAGHINARIVDQDTGETVTAWAR